MPANHSATAELRRPALRHAAVLACAVLVIALALTRALMVERLAGSYTSCEWCFFPHLLGHDSWMIASVLALLAAATAAKASWLRALAGGLAGLAMLAVGADVLVFDLLAQRLQWADIWKFAGEASANWSVISPRLDSPGGIAIFALGAIAVVTALILWFPAQRSVRLSRACTAAALACAAFALAMNLFPLRYVRGDLLGNIVEVNLPQGRAAALTAPFVQREHEQLRSLRESCEQASQPKSNVIIVLTESLSAHQSRLLGGPLDWTPKLDAMARNNHYFSHFYANGFTTDGGMISTLAGRVPITPSGKLFHGFDHFLPAAGTLPEIAHRSGHAANFFSSFDLSFIGTGAWLGKLGFDRVEGKETSWYERFPRRQFGAVDDAVLFERVVHWLDQRDNDQPFVAVVMTLSSHPPFLDPTTSRIDPAASFAYVDSAIDNFYRQLKARGFLDDGVLLITGDHRSMTPVGREEYRRFGERSDARIPLIVAGAVDMPKVVDAAFQQTDIPASVGYFLGNHTCRTPFTGSFLRPDPQPPRYVVHARSDDRDRIDVYHGADGLAQFRLAGDASGWVGEPPPDGELVAAWLNSQRVPASGRDAASTGAAH